MDPEPSNEKRSSSSPSLLFLSLILLVGLALPSSLAGDPPASEGQTYDAILNAEANLTGEHEETQIALAGLPATLNSGIFRIEDVIHDSERRLGSEVLDAADRVIGAGEGDRDEILDALVDLEARLMEAVAAVAPAAEVTLQEIPGGGPHTEVLALVTVAGVPTEPTTLEVRVDGVAEDVPQEEVEPGVYRLQIPKGGGIVIVAVEIGSGHATAALAVR